MGRAKIVLYTVIQHFISLSLQWNAPEDAYLVAKKTKSMTEKENKGGWQRFGIGVFAGIILYKLIFDVLLPMFTG